VLEEALMKRALFSLLRRETMVIDRVRPVMCGQTGPSTLLQVVAEEFRDLRLNADMDGRTIDTWRVLTCLRHGRQQEGRANIHEYEVSARHSSVLRRVR
jgi:hypothetical protein